MVELVPSGPRVHAQQCNGNHVTPTFVVFEDATSTTSSEAERAENMNAGGGASSAAGDPDTDDVSLSHDMLSSLHDLAEVQWFLCVRARVGHVSRFSSLSPFPSSARAVHVLFRAALRVQHS